MEEKQSQTNTELEATMETTSVSETETTPTAKDVTVKKSSPLLLILAIVVVLGGFAAWWWHEQGGSFALQEVLQTQEENDDSLPEVVATVNGEDIAAEVFMQSHERTLETLTAQGIDTSDSSVLEGLRDQTLSVLVNTSLLVQAAEASEDEVTQEEIDEQLAQLEVQFGSKEALETRMQELGMSEDDLRNDVREQIIVDAYLSQSEEFKNLEVTQVEIDAAYAELAAQYPDIPPQAEIETQLSQQLLSQKQQAATQAVVERLRAEADIELFI